MPRRETLHFCTHLNKQIDHHQRRQLFGLWVINRPDVHDMGLARRQDPTRSFGNQPPTMFDAEFRVEEIAGKCRAVETTKQAV